MGLGGNSAAASGATTSSGGSSAVSGVGGTGGNVASGGNAAAAFGGAAGSGGSSAGSAGASGAGGSSGSGGASGSGGSPGSGGASGSGGGTGGAAGGTSCVLPETFQWTAGAPAIVPKSDAAHNLVSVKDPTIVRFNGRWHVYATSVASGGIYGMIYTSFADWAEASSSPFYYMSATPGFDTYVAAPQLFYFTPQNKWYLIFQSGPPMYSTADDPGDPTRWTRPAPFFASTPAIITQNDGWLDFWIICDSEFCHLFFSDDHGRWYKSRTSIASFPNGFGEPVIVMQDPEAGRLFEASNVYKVQGASRYLALIEAFDSTSNWRRYFRSWTAESLEGPWLPLEDAGTAPFAGAANVAFNAGIWTNDISHGELIRAGHDERLELDACNLQFLIQGVDPTFQSDDYNSIPWRLGLLTLR